eukprot:366097-Chlamydomonas_euryale.AAC.10
MDCLACMIGCCLRVLCGPAAATAQPGHRANVTPRHGMPQTETLQWAFLAGLGGFHRGMRMRPDLGSPASSHSQVRPDASTRTANMHGRTSFTCGESTSCPRWLNADTSAAPPRAACSSRRNGS